MGNYPFLTQLSTLPIYNTKAVVQETGVPADTFRAWERRYGIPNPHRTNGGHRLYSEREIAVIRWLRDRTGEGLTISQAIALMANSNDPSLSPQHTSRDTEPHNWERLSHQLISSFIEFDEKQADYILSEAFALYAFDDVLAHLIYPTMVDIGELWHQGKISIPVEHFATQFVQRKLLSIFNTYARNQGRGLIVIGCAPSERHEMGILLLAISLVRQGWRVVYLGAQIPQEDLIQTVKKIQPNMVCLSASQQHTAQEIVEIGHVLRALGPSAPHFGFGGRIFSTHPDLRASVPGMFLGEHAQQAAETIGKVLTATLANETVRTNGKSVA